MSASRILNIAKKEVGVKESPAGSNLVKYNTAYYGRAVQGSNYAWCAVFLWWVFKQAGLSNLYYGGKKTAYCPALLDYYKQQGRIIKSDFKPGDIVFFNFSGGKTPKHVGIIQKVNGNKLTTIEGNTGVGNDANGGAVMQRTRYTYQVVGVARPAYTPKSTTTATAGGKNTVEITLNVLKSGSKGDTVKALQILLNGYGYSCGTADGQFGSKTVAALKKYQKAQGLTADGIAGAKTWEKLLK